MTVKFFGRKSGGGGSGAGGVPDTLRSADHFELILGLIEGPIKGLVDGTKNFYVGKTALTNSNGENNFKEFELTVLPGAQPDESVTSKLGGFAASSDVGQELAKGVPVTRTGSHASPVPHEVEVLPNPIGYVGEQYIKVTSTGKTYVWSENVWVERNQDITALEVRLAISQLFNMNKKGQPTPHNVKVRIEYKGISASSWTRPFGDELMILGKTTSTYVKELRWEVTPINEPYEIRVTKLDPGEDDPDTVAVISWESFQEVSTSQFGAPGVSMIHLVGQSTDQFTSIPDFWGVYDLRLIRVPSNYDPEARTYDGVWDGTFKLAWSNNPAWCLYDFVMNDTFGMNAYYPVVLDKWDTYEAGRWCDTPVSDGKGGTRPRFTLNLVIGDPRGAKEMARYMAGLFGAVYFDDGNGTAHLRIDKDDAAVALFTPENVVDGEFRYNFTDINARHNDITVSFVNPNLEWAEDRRRVFDQVHIDKYGRIPKDIVAVGCTNDSEAIARAKYDLITGLTETMLVDFRTNRLGEAVAPYDIILIGDESLGYSITGRAKTIVSSTELTLRDPIYLETGVTYVANFQIPNPDYPASSEKPYAIERRTLSASSPRGATLTLQFTAELPDLPPNAVFSLESSSGAGLPKPFRVLKVEEVEGSPDLFSISAVEVNRDKWLYIDGETSWQEQTSYSLLTPERVLPPEGPLEIELTSELVAGRIRPTLSLRWKRSPSKFVRRYLVRMRRDGEQMQELGTTSDLKFDIYDLPGGDYEFEVVASNLTGGLSAPLIGSRSIRSDTRTVTAATNLRMIGEPSATEFESLSPRFEWDASEDPWFGTYIVSVEDVALGTVRRTVETTNPWFDYRYEMNQDDGLQRNFRIKVVVEDQFGNESAPAQLAVNNPRPPVPSGIAVEPTMGGASVHIDQPTFRDWAGVKIWRGTSPGFTPGPSNLVYEGRDTWFRWDGTETSYFRLASIDEFDRNDYALSAEYAVTPYTAADNEPPAVPTGLTLTSTLNADGTVKLVATWTGGTEDDFAHFDIELKEGTGNYVSFITGSNRREWTVQPNTAFSARVRAFDTSGNRSAFSTVATHTTVQDTAPPHAITAATAKGTFQSVWLTHTPATTGPTLAHVEIWESSTNDRANATLIERATSLKTLRGDLPNDATRYYWWRPVSISGIAGPWYPTSATAGVEAKTNRLVEQDLADGAIAAQKLAQDIRDQIDKVSGMETAIGALEETYGDTISAAQSAAAALDAKNAAIQAESDAVAAKAAAEIARNTAQGASADAIQAKADAEIARNTAQGASSDAITAKVAAELARDDASAHRVSAETAKISAESVFRDAVQLHGNPRFQFGRAGWGNSIAGGQEILDEIPTSISEIISDPDYGQAIRITGPRYLIAAQATPTDPNRIYRLRAIVKRGSTDYDALNFGVQSFDAFHMPVGSTGVTYIDTSVPVGTDWTEITGTVTGTGNGNGQFRPGSVSFRPLLRVNGSDVNSKTTVAEFSFEDITESQAALGHATAAAGSASNAATSATDAASAATSATTTKNEVEAVYRKTVLINRNANFSEGLMGWAYPPGTSNTNEIVDDYTESPTTIQVIDDIGKGGGRVLRAHGYRYLVSAKAIPIDTSRTYRVTGRVRRVAAHTTGTSYVYFGVRSEKADFTAEFDGANPNSYCAANAAEIPVGPEWSEFSGLVTGEGTGTNQFRPGAAHARALMLLGYTATDGILEVDELLFEDVTESMAAANSASAAATSASQASGYADDAESAATASNNAKVAAESARDTAQSHATAAAGSASTASTHATNAGNSASAANTAKVAAESAKGDAETARNTAQSHASAAGTSATTAGTHATNAGNSASAANTAKVAAESAKTAAEEARDTAQGHRNTALTHANAAATSASNASTSATDAASAATSATTAKNEAEAVFRDTIILNGNSAFEHGLKGWTISQAGQSPVDAEESAVRKIIDGVGSKGGRVYEAVGPTVLYSAHTIPVDTSRKYRVRVRLRQSVNRGAGGTTCLVGVNILDANYLYLHNRYCTLNRIIDQSEGWIDAEGIITGVGTANNTFHADTVYMRAALVLNYPSNSSGGTTQVDYIEIDDVTDMIAAAGSATAAATSASQASGYADDAESSATAANSAKVAAESARNTAQSHANAASTSASNAATSATNAGNSATAANSAKVAAESAKGAAETARNTAQTHATAAGTSASNASTSATDAASAATSATTAKNEAEASYKGVVALNGNARFLYGRAGWSDATTGGEVIAEINPTVTEIVPDESGNIMKITGPRYLVMQRPIPIDPSRTYRLKLRARRRSTDHNTVNIGIQNYDASFLPTGASTGVSYTAIGTTIGTTWTERVGIVTGTGAANGQFRPGAVYFRPIMRANGSDNTSQIQIAEFSVEDITESVAANNSATAAATSASQASGSATNAASAATSATTAKNEAQAIYRKSVLLNRNPNFDEGTVGWSSSAAAGTEIHNDWVPSAGVLEVVDGVGKAGSRVLRAYGYRQVYAAKPIPIDPARTYRVSGRVRRTVNASGTGPIYIGVRNLKADFTFDWGAGVNPNSYGASSGHEVTIAEGWREFSGLITGTGATSSTFRPDTAYVRPLAFLGYGASDGVVEIDELHFEDVTDSVAANNSALAAANSASQASGYADDAESSATAANSAKVAAESARNTAQSHASAASSSASTATTKASEAASSASAASGHANTAQTQAGIATTKAGEAATSASTAAGHAVTASNYALLSAAVSAGGSFTINPIFEDWTGSGPPAGMSHWGSGTLIRDTSIKRTGSHSVRLAAPTGTNPALELLPGGAAWAQNISRHSAEYVVVECDFYVNVNTLSGAGIILYWYSESNETEYAAIKFTDEISPVVGTKWYSIRKVIKKPGSVVFDKFRALIMTNYSSLFGPEVGKTIWVDRFVVREATTEEKRTFNVASEIADAVSVETSARTTAISGLDTRITANEGNISSQGSAITSLQSNLESVGVWERGYAVNISNHLHLKNADGTSPLRTTQSGSGSSWASYTVEGWIPGTGTATGSVARFKASGAGWTMEHVSRRGTTSNHVEFFIDGNGHPSVKLYGHESTYTVRVRHTLHAAGNSPDQVNAIAINSLDTRVTSAEGTISAHATSLSSLTTTVGGHTTTISQHATSINGIQGKWTVKTDTNGYISGFGLISTANTATPSSEFFVLADKFKIASPGATAAAPFIVESGKVYIDNAVIKAESITTDKLAITSRGACLNTDPMTEDASAWESDSSGGFQIVPVSAIPGSKTAIRGDTTNGVYVFTKQVSIDTSKTYRLRIRIYGAAGANRTTYLAASFHNFAGVKIPGSETPGVGWQVGGYHYWGLVNAIPPVGLSTHEILMGPGEAYQAPAGARAMRLGALLHYQGTTGFYYMTDVRIEEVLPSVLIKDGAITAAKLTTGEVITASAQIRDAIIKSAHIESLSAAKLEAGTTLSSSIIVNGNTLSTINTRASDPAARINAVSTLIDPGKILISGNTTLFDWRKGGDATKIDGGAISANTVTANKMSVGVRGIDIIGLEFEHNSPSANRVSWTDGTIIWIDNSGSPAAANIAAGTVIWSSGTQYIYWVQGATTLSNTTSYTTALGENNVVLATYRGGTNLVATYGRTIIDGDKIKTGTVDTNALKANAVTADIVASNAIEARHVKANSINATHIAAKSLTAEHVVVASGANLIPNPNFADGGFSGWNAYSSPANQATIEIATVSGLKGTSNSRYARRLQAGSAITSMFTSTTSHQDPVEGFKVTPGEVLYVRFKAAKSSNLNVTLNCAAYFQNESGSAASAIAVSLPSGSLTTSLQEYSGTVTVPANVSNGKLYFYLPGSGSAVGYVYFTEVEVVRQAEAVHIKNGAITADKIAANSIEAGHIKAGEITGDKFAANTIIGNNLYLGGSTANGASVLLSGNSGNPHIGIKHSNGQWAFLAQQTGPRVILRASTGSTLLDLNGNNLTFGNDLIVTNNLVANAVTIGDTVFTAAQYVGAGNSGGLREDGVWETLQTINVAAGQGNVLMWVQMLLRSTSVSSTAMIVELPSAEIRVRRASDNAVVFGPIKSTEIEINHRSWMENDNVRNEYWAEAQMNNLSFTLMTSGSGNFYLEAKVSDDDSVQFYASNRGMTYLRVQR